MNIPLYFSNKSPEEMFHEFSKTGPFKEGAVLPIYYSEVVGMNFRSSKPVPENVLERLKAREVFRRVLRPKVELAVHRVVPLKGKS